jgi:hypothetical protein
MPLGQILDDEENNYEENKEKNILSEYHIRLFKMFTDSLFSRIEQREQFNTFFCEFIAIFGDGDHGINLQFDGEPPLYYNYEDDMYYLQLYGLGEFPLSKEFVLAMLKRSFIRRAKPLTFNDVIEVLFMISS